MTNKVYISWVNYQKDVRSLAKRIRDRNITSIIAVTRGGLFPAAILSTELGIRLVDTLCLSSYVHDRQGEMTILKKPEIDLTNTLIIDDLSDTGNTARVIKELFPNSFYCCVYVKPKGAVYSDEFVREYPQDTWIVQPWDVGEDGFLD